MEGDIPMAVKEPKWRPRMPAETKAKIAATQKKNWRNWRRLQKASKTAATKDNAA
jgi:hypothetical protein